MERFDILEKKIHLAAEQITALRREKQKLLDEIASLREANRRTEDLVHENEGLREQKRTVSSRIEKLLKKINSLKI